MLDKKEDYYGHPRDLPIVVVEDGHAEVSIK